MNLKKVIAACALAYASVNSFAADTASLSTPSHAIKTMRLVVHISDNDPTRWGSALNNIRNVQNEVGAGKVDVEVVAIGPGLGLLMDDSLLANRVQEAIKAGVHFVACRNTMNAEHIAEAEMTPGIGYVQAGVVEIINKQLEGYAYLRP